jgi:hypothetical protein
LHAIKDKTNNEATSKLKNKSSKRSPALQANIIVANILLGVECVSKSGNNEKIKVIKPQNKDISTLFVAIAETIITISAVVAP